MDVVTLALAKKYTDTFNSQVTNIAPTSDGTGLVFTVISGNTFIISVDDWNTLTNEEKIKLSVIDNSGDGNKYLSNNGTYKEIIGVTPDYDTLDNKPKINSVTLKGNVLSSSLGIKTSELNNDSDFITTEQTEELLSNKENSFSKNTAFNKNFGTTSGTVCEGNDSRLSNSRTPVSHASTATTYGAASTTNYGHTKLSSSISSTSVALAATPSAVKEAYDLADKALPKAGGTISGTVSPSTDNSLNLGAQATRFKSLYALVLSSYKSVLRLTTVSDSVETIISGRGLTVNDSDQTAYKPIWASAFTVSSSKHLKKNIKEITEEETKKLLELNPVSFDYINGIENKRGLIAEEVMQVYPECVNIPDDYDEDKYQYDEEKDYCENASKAPSIDYSTFVPYLIKMIQMQENRIKILEDKLSI